MFWVAFIFLLGLVVFAWAIACVVGSRVLTRRPPSTEGNSPDRYGLAYEEIHFQSHDHTPLYGWWIPAHKSKATVIICHGSSGSMGRDTIHAKTLHDAGFNVLMFDFRAHGQSGGTESTFGMFEKDDLICAMDHLASRYGVARVGVLGFSMGGTAALITAAFDPRIAVIVADSAIIFLKNTMARAMPVFIPYFVRWQYAAWILVVVGVRTRGRIDQVDPALWVNHVRAPILYIHCGLDHLVTRQDVMALRKRAVGLLEVHTAERVTHRNAMNAMGGAYGKLVVDWFNRHLAN
jgi:uncharacterized protein